MIASKLNNWKKTWRFFPCLTMRPVLSRLRFHSLHVNSVLKSPQRCQTMIYLMCYSTCSSEEKNCRKEKESDEYSAYCPTECLYVVE